MREKLGLRPGDPLEARLEGGSIVITPKRRRRRKARIIIDPRTGLAVLTLGPGAPILTHRQVREMLVDFP
jgi:bifunctional DNA-binding transcriptional regulator/antitoxin component of YhaV-PrlF toxin-antitoxin module